jgi:hypothetical protein
MAKGVEIRFGARSITFYPLTIGQIEELADEIAALRAPEQMDGNLFDVERFRKLVRIFTKSAKRGDPSITEEDIRAVVDVENIHEVTMAVMGQSRFRQISPEEAGAPTSPQIGGASEQA